MESINRLVLSGHKIGSVNELVLLGHSTCFDLTSELVKLCFVLLRVLVLRVTGFGFTLA